ncbi:MAG: helix-turn-helix domain-containing protein [Vicinamibacterales bacterium]|nr:helix-turn-helix domain-containing protein [Vicinamibacterales bacterium]
MTAPVLAALASPRRCEILRLTWRRELAAGEIHRALPDVTFGAVSLHLRTLARAGLIDARVDGRFRRYRANRAALGPLAASLERMWRDRLWRLKLLAELDHARRGPRARGASRPRTPKA